MTTIPAVWALLVFSEFCDEGRRVFRDDVS
jgi:hypothetical protein